jgi:hypothetical protein
MGKIIVALIVVVLLATLLYRRSRHNANSAPQRRKGAVVNAGASAHKSSAARQAFNAQTANRTGPDYRAVSVRTKLGACSAAVALQDEVFLASEAPELPLPDCDAVDCGCRYVYLSDRRQDDRRTPFGEKHGVVGSVESNRRSHGDRRQ